MKNRVNFDDKRLNDYCSENAIIITNKLPVIITRNTRLEGKCLTCDNIFNKTFRSMIKVGAYCKVCSMKLCVIKRETTCLERIGVKNPNQSKEIIEKRKITNTKIYGFPIASQNKEVREKMKKTQRETYDDPIKNKIIQDKKKKTSMERYDKENPAQVEEFKEKMKKTNIERYDVENAMKSPIVKEINKKAIYDSQGGYTYNVPELMVKVKKQ